MIRYVYFVLVCLLVFTVVGIEFREQAFRNPDPKVLLEQRSQQLFESACSKCHGLDEVHKAQHSAQAWTTVLKRMQVYSGGSITDEQNGLIYQHILKIKDLHE